MRSRIAMFAVATATAAAATAIFSGTALADPPASHTVALTDIIGVGSDTVQFALDDTTTGANGFDATQSPTNYVDSWDAVNPSTGTTGDTITPKPGCSFARPNGSSAGINALLADQLSTSDNATPCVDYARSSRAPQNGDQGLAFLPFAQDTVEYATSAPTTSFPSTPATNAPQTLTAANLATIYSCGASGHSVSHWNDFGATSTDAVQAVIPQPGSGTRTFFEGSIGVSDATIQAGVTSGCLTQVEEHDPAPIRANADRIGPFSVARFNSIDADAGIQVDGTQGFNQSRIVYNVVRIDANGNIPAYLVPFFGDGGVSSTGWICSSAAQSILQSTDGFAPISLSGHSCGVAETFNG